MKKNVGPIGSRFETKNLYEVLVKKYLNSLKNIRL